MSDPSGTVQSVLIALLGTPSVADVERAIVRGGPATTTTLLTVVPRPPAAQIDLRLPSIDRPLVDLLIEARTDWATGFADSLRFDVEIRVACGGEVRTIVEEAAAGDYDYVALVGDHSASARLATARLIELCPTPVLIEPGGIGEIRPDVIAAIDPDAADELNESIVRAAAVAAKATGGQVHLLHAWALAGEADLLRNPNLDLSGRDVADFAEVVQAAHRRAFDEMLEAVALPVLAAAGGPPHTTHLILGTIRDAVKRIVDIDRVGLVVTGTQGRVAVERALGGSDARQVADADAYATLVLKPAGFVSPLV